MGHMKRYLDSDAANCRTLSQQQSVAMNSMLMGEDSGDSGLSSDNSGFSRSADQRQQRSGGANYPGGYPSQQTLIEYPGSGPEGGTPQRSPRGTMTRSSDSAPPARPPGGVRSITPRTRT